MTRIAGGVFAFVVGAAIAIGSALWRKSIGELDQAPSFIFLAACATGALGSMLLQLARGVLVDNLGFAQAAGIDESRKSSKVTLVFAGLLFVPLWAASLVMAVGSLAPGATLERLIAWSLISLFLTLLVYGLVREWRRSTTVIASGSISQPRPAPQPHERGASAGSFTEKLDSAEKPLDAPSPARERTRPE